MITATAATSRAHGHDGASAPLAGPLVVGIDASRNRSGGAKAHLIGILNHVDPRDHDVAGVHVWSYPSLLAALPDRPWLVRHSPAQLSGSLAAQLWWQSQHLPGELRLHGCNVLLSTDAGTVCRFEPSVVMSRDMLSFEPGEMGRFGIGPAWLRLLALRHVQVNSLRRAAAALFLTRYAADTIQTFTGRLARVRIVPHGISDRFRREPASVDVVNRDFKCLYVSNVDVYKHQWNVVRAIAQLRAAGYALQLELVGGRSGRAEDRLSAALAECDSRSEFVTLAGELPHDAIADRLAQCDLFIFASSCENMPNTLVEAMASGLPIACSNRGPMPEVLADGGIYFDPEDPDSIAAAIRMLVNDPRLRRQLAERARQRASEYSWARCARETWSFLSAVARESTSGRGSPIGAGPEHIN